MRRESIVLGVLAAAVVGFAAYAQTESEGSGQGTLWGATALGGVAVAQWVKKTVDEVLPGLLGKKGTYYRSSVASFGIGVLAYLIFPQGRAQVLDQGFSIFQGGATASAISAAIYKLIGGRLGLPRAA
jgi:hypothetical protein